MSTKLIIIGIIGVVAIGGFFLSQSSSLNEANVNDGKIQNTPTQTKENQVPNLSFEDYDGNTIALRDFGGTPLVVNSWAVWCPFCVKELSEFAQVRKERGEEFVLIAVDRAESLEITKKFTDELGVTDDLLFVLDPKDSFYRAIGGFSMPETIFVDRDGVIQFHKRGPMDANEFRDRLQLIL